MVATMKMARGAGVLGAEIMRHIFEDCAARAGYRLAGGDVAEIIPGIEPKWHIVVTVPGRDLYAADQLSARRFGIYLPEIDRKGRIERMFPGHVFVFVWGIQHHASRIETCPGVSHILCRRDGEPAQLTDKQIGQIVVEEMSRVWSAANRKRRNRKKSNEFNPDIPQGYLRVSTKGYFRGVAELESDTRIGVLHKTLDLSS